MEGGANWMNARFRALSIPSQFYLIVLIQGVINAGRLPSYAANDSAASALFNRINVTLLSQPSFGIDQHGYNTGNYLLCLIFFWSEMPTSVVFRFVYVHFLSFLLRLGYDEMNEYIIFINRRLKSFND